MDYMSVPREQRGAVRSYLNLRHIIVLKCSLSPTSFCHFRYASLEMSTDCSLDYYSHSMPNNALDDDFLGVSPTNEGVPDAVICSVRHCGLQCAREPIVHDHGDGCRIKHRPLLCAERNNWDPSIVSIDGPVHRVSSSNESHGL